jgi:hypothetical protein
MREAGYGRSIRKTLSARMIAGVRTLSACALHPAQASLPACGPHPGRPRSGSARHPGPRCAPAGGFPTAPPHADAVRTPACPREAGCCSACRRLSPARGGAGSGACGSSPPLRPRNSGHFIGKRGSAGSAAHERGRQKGKGKRQKGRAEFAFFLFPFAFEERATRSLRHPSGVRATRARFRGRRCAGPRLPSCRPSGAGPAGHGSGGGAPLAPGYPPSPLRGDPAGKPSLTYEMP